MKLGERLNRVLVAMLLLPDAKAVATDRDVISQGRGGHGSHKARNAPSGAFAPLEDRPLVLQWAERFDRMLKVAERELEEARQGGGAGPSHDKVSARHKAETRTILRDYVGVDPTAVAFAMHRTTEGVRKLRQRHGLDPETGERARSNVLTAPAHIQARVHESTEG